MGRFRNKSTNLVVHRDDDGLLRFARWEKLPDVEPVAATEPAPLTVDQDDGAAAIEPAARPVARHTGRGWYQVDGMDRKVQRKDLPDGVEIVEG